MRRSSSWFDRALRTPLGIITLFLAVGRPDPLLYVSAAMLLVAGVLGYCPLGAPIAVKAVS